ncbi:hypothetical protein GCM10008171_26310 [Methylopila jiangsuensis]|uniref:DUF559 domain-containing protein n=1 Tax=Methylopila jiangsuensis TaxID=586230 RepID=A0A9W6JHY2_9HYPH|nr:DUF559 domain-containing protein [Methylopila jiangsuensis]MDR6285233.1 adenine-specific DNA-methyltransferase [Methylopila jiangsuensis]GLK77377.1 hypothetical protein GCM10008171_26310 [Methylopila jiangsuensis]
MGKLFRTRIGAGRARRHLSPAGRGREAHAERVRGMRRFKARAKALRNTQTSAEATLWQALGGRRLERRKFRRQHPIDGFVVDFVTLAGKLIVEVDGVTHGADAEICRDRARTERLERDGFFVMRVSNADVYDNLEGVLEAISAQLSGR